MLVKSKFKSTYIKGVDGKLYKFANYVCDVTDAEVLKQMEAIPTVIVSKDTNAKDKTKGGK